jgi:HAD superfamily hydrolase (TIGR01549 family)
LLDEFARELEIELMECEIASGLQALRNATPNAKWSILSGGDQQEIRTLFAKRHLADFFNGGLFGSPDNKDEVLAREKANGNLQFPALFVGDSKYDYEAASRAGLDFIFVTDWTEVADWHEYCSQYDLTTMPNISALLAN